MNNDLRKPRWPVLEIILLVFFPVPFTDQVPLIGVLQPVYGMLPGFLQFGIIFTVAPFITLSSAKLTVLAARAGGRTQMVLCAICSVLGLLAMAYAALVVFALGARAGVFLFVGIGIVIAVLIVFAGNMRRISNRRKSAK